MRDTDAGVVPELETELEVTSLSIGLWFSREIVEMDRSRERRVRREHRELRLVRRHHFGTLRLEFAEPVESSIKSIQAAERMQRGSIYRLKNTHIARRCAHEEAQPNGQLRRNGRAK